MTLLYQSPMFERHQTGPRHPERPERVAAIARHLARTGLDRACEQPRFEPLSAAQLARAHRASYVASILQAAAQGGGRIESDTVISSESFDVAALAAGAAVDAVRRVLTGPDHRALCLVRPPGHHALVDAPMGFCLFNNMALAARSAVDEQGLSRVLIVDWDVHHGNGTQDAFWEDGQVGFFSIHRWPFYPGSGAADETGTGAGLGWTRNLPLEFGTPRQTFLDQFQRHLEDFAARVRPELVLISAGFDAHRDDPVGSLGLETEDFATLTRMVLDVAQGYSGGRVVSLLEGGYSTGALAGSVELHLGELLNQQRRESAGEQASS